MADDSNINYNSNSEDEIRNRFFELTTKAAIAENSGEELSAVNLYLAAYELVKNGNDDARKNALLGIKKAWDIVIKTQNRPLAEYIFEILSKNISSPEIDKYSEELHNLMLDKLKGLGLPIDSLANTSNANEALSKMRDFISGFENKKAENKTAENSEIKNKISNPNEQIKKEENKQSDKDAYLVRREVNKYNNLVGYNTAINFMREKGIVGGRNNQYMQLVERLNKEHGLNRISFSKTLIFQSPSREDANVFMEATASEIGMPCIQMHMDDNIQGSSVLCMMAPADSNFRLNPGRTGFNGKGILMLSDIDTWDFPDIDPNSEEGMASFFSMQMSRGVAEIMNLIEIALEDPNILVMASVGDEVHDLELKKMLDDHPFYIIHLDNPNEQERADIWSKLAHDHPSLRAFSIQKLVNYSKNMSRYDIELAVHEALEDAYRRGIQQKQYIPLSIANIVEKLADHQPLDSTEYKTLEDVATEDFKKDLENIDDILK